MFEFEVPELQSRYIFYQGIFKIQMDFALYYDIKTVIIDQIKRRYYLRIFRMACLINNKKLKIEAFSYFKKNDLLNRKKITLYWISKFSIIRPLLIKLIIKD